MHQINDVGEIISIIVPFLNEETRIVRQLTTWYSWRDQRQVELLFVDGGSEDSGAEILQNAGFFVLQSAPGRAVQMNTGAAQAKGQIFWFLHMDTQIDHFAAIIHYLLLQLNDKSKTDFWGFCRIKIDSESTVWHKARMLQLIGFMINTRTKFTGIATGDQGQFFSASLFASLGQYPVQPLLEDVELAHRARRRVRPLIIPFTLITSGRRWLKQGIWRTIFLMWKIRFNYWRGVSPNILAKAYNQVR